MSQNKAEVWLRGPLPNVPPLLQPVAHALLQVREELNELMVGFPDELLWERPAGLASPGFHLQHLTGVLDRLFTYAGGEALNEQQLDYLSREGKAYIGNNLSETLVKAFNNQVNNALNILQNTNESTLTETKGVGRAQIPSTVIGLLVHAAEHTTRHYGQLLVTVKVLKAR
ncbi:MAG: DinB family protein [Mucilaginibacter sp.]|uniref:DinB family protein n=1 Tax=Mucilaginibacter sp. TaxID=1882438 RepID=UPI003266B007